MSKRICALAPAVAVLALSLMAMPIESRAGDETLKCKEGTLKAHSHPESQSKTVECVASGAFPDDLENIAVFADLLRGGIYVVAEGRREIQDLESWRPKAAASMCNALKGLRILDSSTCEKLCRRAEFAAIYSPNFLDSSRVGNVNVRLHEYDRKLAADVVNSIDNQNLQTKCPALLASNRRNMHG